MTPVQTGIHYEGDLMTRRRVWDERQGDLFGMPAPAPTDTPKRSVPSRSPPSSEQVVEATSLSSMAERATRPEMDELVNELEDADLAYLTVRGVRALKRRLARRGKSRGTRGMKRGTPLDRALQDIAAELSELENPDDAW